MWMRFLGITYHMMFWNKPTILQLRKKWGGWRGRKMSRERKSKTYFFYNILLTKNLNQLHSMGKKGMEISLSSTSWGCSEENKMCYSRKGGLRTYLSCSPSGVFRIRGDTKLLWSKSVCHMIVHFMCRSGDCFVKWNRNCQQLEASRRTEWKH